MREETLIIAGAALVVVVLGGAGLLSVRSSDTTPTVVAPVITDSQPLVAEVPFTTLVQGTTSSVAKRINYRATSASQLKELWKMISATSTPPAINFATQEVIGVFAGKQPTTGFAIAVSKIEDAAARVVSITIARPDGTCTKKQLATAPYEIIAVPATTLPLTHEDMSTTTGCP